MSFLPVEIVENINEYKQENINEYYDFIYDENTHRLTTIGNQRESLREWIRCALLIPRYVYGICPFDYGQEFSELVDAGLSEEEKKDLFEYFIIDALKVNEFIDDVVVENIIINNDKISANINIKSIFGDEIDYEYNI